jgi:squalene-hopene/tetraprenyl-beta-curcumene cyclase
MDANDGVATGKSRLLGTQTRRQSRIVTTPQAGESIENMARVPVVDNRGGLAERDHLRHSADGPESVDLEDLRVAIRRTSDWLWNRQHPDGHWCAELEGDTILESEYILLLAWLGEESSARAKQAALYIAEQQSGDGGWPLFPGGPMDVTVSVKAYMALKLTGTPPTDPSMQRAREAILAAGGADRVNSFTRFYLALLGQIPFELCPAVPPELVLLPDWFPVNIYRLSSWSRTIFVPLSIVWALRPVRQLSEQQSITELFVQPPAKWPPLRSPGSQPPRHPFTWDTFFRGTDRLLKGMEWLRIRPFRQRALHTARHWMLERFADSDGLGAIFPPIIWSIIALRAMGHAADDPSVVECHQQLDALILPEESQGTSPTGHSGGNSESPELSGDSRNSQMPNDLPEPRGQIGEGVPTGDSGLSPIRLQPCKSPVWDTTLALRGLLAAQGTQARVTPHELDGVYRAVQWLLDREVRQAGDWRRRVQADPGGWYFEYRNAFYPDVDDSIMAIMTLGAARERLLAKTDSGRPSGGSAADSPPIHSDGIVRMRDEQNRSAQAAAIEGARERAVRWVLAMQNQDGGWGAFDRDNDAEFLCHVPFADHNAMIDPSTPDITARVLESLASWGIGREQPAVIRALRYLYKTQEEDGSWYGRWGVNHIYGTWQVLVGLASMEVSPADSAMRRGAEWLLACQQDSGGWGESPLSYDDVSWRGRGQATASQTAWAMLGLLAAGYGKDDSIRRGVNYLIGTQRPDGGWDEPEFTGTGFPRVFYLRYHMYPIYFPLLALSQAYQALEK